MRTFFRASTAMVFLGTLGCPGAPSLEGTWTASVWNEPCEGEPGEFAITFDENGGGTAGFAGVEWTQQGRNVQFRLTDYRYGLVWEYSGRLTANDRGEGSWVTVEGSNEKGCWELVRLPEVP